MKQNIIILIIFTFSSSLLAQNKSVVKLNNIEMSVGLNQIKEENINNKVHSGTSYVLKYNHKKEKKNLARYGISFLFSKIKTKYENANRSMNIQLKGNYAYLFKLKENENFKLFFGPSISANYRLSFFPNWDDSHLYWADDFSLGVASKIDYLISKNKSLLFDLDFSALSLYNRPELYRNYKIDNVSFGGIVGNMNSNFKLGTINSAFTLSFQTEYRFKLSEKILQAVVYSLDYSHFKTKKSLPFQNIIHQLSFKIYF